MKDVSDKTIDWINSGEYKVDIDEMRTTIMRECKLSNSESSTASIFENELYFLIRSKTGIKIDYYKEKAVNNVKHKFWNIDKEKLRYRET